MPDDELQEGGGKENEGKEGGLMSGWRGWAIVISVVVIEAIFFVFMLHMQSSKKPDSTADGEDAVEMPVGDYMKVSVSMDKLTYSIPTSGGMMRDLIMSVTFVMQPTQQEVRDSVVIPDADWAKFKEAVEKMKPQIQDELNRYIRKQAASDLNTERGQARIREFLKDTINDELERLNLELSSEKIDKRRVQMVLLTNFYMS